MQVGKIYKFLFADIFPAHEFLSPVETTAGDAILKRNKKYYRNCDSGRRSRFFKRVTVQTFLSDSSNLECVHEVANLKFGENFL